MLTHSARTGNFIHFTLRDTKELNWCQHLRSSMGGHHDLVNPYNMAVSRIICISDLFATAKPKPDFLNPRHSFPYFPKSPFMLIGMVGKACLRVPSNAYFPWTFDYTPFIFGPTSVCLNIPYFDFVYIDFDFLKYDFSMLTSDALHVIRSMIPRISCTA